MTNYVASIIYKAFDNVSPALKKVRESVQNVGKSIEKTNLKSKLSSLSLGNAMNNLGGGFKRFGSRASDVLANVGRGISKMAMAARGALLGIGAGALVSLKNTASYMQQVKGFMRVSGQSAGDSSILVSLAARYKLDSNLLGRSMTILSKKAMENSKAFRKWGVDLKDSHGQLLPATKMLELVAYKYKKLGGGLQGAAMAQALMGRGAIKLLPVLKLGAEGINSYAREAAKMGLVLTEKNIKDFDEYMKATRQVQGCMAGLEVQLGVKLLPRIVQLCGWIENMVHKWENLAPAVRSNIIKWGAFLTVTVAIIPQLMKMIQLVNDTKVALIGLGIAQNATNINYEAYCAWSLLAEGATARVAGAALAGTPALLAYGGAITMIAGSLIYLATNKTVQQGISNLLSVGTVSGVSRQALGPVTEKDFNPESVKQMKAKGYTLDKKTHTWTKSKTEINVNINAPKGTVQSVSTKSTGNQKVGVSTAGRKVAHAH